MAATHFSGPLYVGGVLVIDENGNVDAPVTTTDLTTTGNTTLGNAVTDTTDINGATTITTTSASGLTVGRQGATAPVLKVNAATASVATGIEITGAAAAGGVALAAISSGTNENLTIDAKGSGTVTIGGTSTGAIALSRETDVTGILTVTNNTNNAFIVGQNGVTNPAFNVDASTASSATGLRVKSAAAAGGLAVSVLSSGTNENLTVDAKGSGTLTLNGTATGNIVLGKTTTLTSTSASTDGGTSVEPFVVASTMTGVGGVGGRAKFSLDTNVALGGWSNALKGITTYGATGKTTGMGSAIVAEMSLSAGTSDGTYAPLEAELVMPSGALTGTATSLLYANATGADVATFQASGHLMNLNGLGTASSATNLFHTTGTVSATHGLRILIDGVPYDILLKASTYA